MNYTSDDKRRIVKDDYNAIADTFFKHYGELDYCKPYIDEFVSQLKGTNVLDIGCGAGQVTNYLTQKGINAIGIDFSQKLLKIARETFPESKFILADICEYEQKKQVDGIIVKDMLFHLPDQNLTHVLLNFKKLLKPSGILCIIMDTPKKTGEQILPEELDDKHQIYYNYLSLENLESMLKNAGFYIDRAELVKTAENVSIYATGLMAIYAKIK